VLSRQPLHVLLHRPYMLQSRLSYTQIGTFSLAAYPYSFKLLWSPIVDALYWRRMGRRKSWIIPIQVCGFVQRNPVHCITCRAWSMGVLPDVKMLHA
jgi:hypothetical protein